MSIARHADRMQVTCNSCPASYPNTYKVEDFTVMILDAKAAGWIVRKIMPNATSSDTTDLFGTAPRIAGAKAEEPFTHTCPSCASPRKPEGLF